MIAIIDYHMGNLRSVQKALEHVGAEAQIVSTPEAITAAPKVVLPGVGAFADGMMYLQRLGLIGPIHSFLSRGRPFLGICLGMQLLFEHSQEDAPSPDQPLAGLAILPGSVERFGADQGRCGCGVRLKVPHMGWNTISWERSDPMLRGVAQHSAVYFVHSYYGEPADPSIRSAVCDYGGTFCASLWRDNIWATQFHPEKSGQVGLKMLANFADL